MNLPESLPLASQLAVDDFKRVAAQIKNKLMNSFKQLRNLEQADFTDDEVSFRKYTAIQRDIDAWVDFVKVAELTIEELCADLVSGPRLTRYHQLTRDNETLRQQYRTLEQVNDLLTDLVLNQA